MERRLLKVTENSKKLAPKIQNSAFGASMLQNDYKCLSAKDKYGGISGI